MKKILSVALLLVLFGISFRPQLVKAIASYFTSNTSSGSVNSTTTLIFMTPNTTTATTTYTLGSNNSQTNNDVDENYVFLQGVASSSSTVFQWVTQYSNNNIDWFNEDGTYSIGITNGLNEVEHASTTVVNSWKPGVAGTTTKAFKITTIASTYKRIQLNVSGANGGVWIMDTAYRRGAGY